MRSQLAMNRCGGIAIEARLSTEIYWEPTVCQALGIQKWIGYHLHQNILLLKNVHGFPISCFMSSSTFSSKHFPPFLSLPALPASKALCARAWNTLFSLLWVCSDSTQASHPGVGYPSSESSPFILTPSEAALLAEEAQMSSDLPRVTC